MDNVMHRLPLLILLLGPLLFAADLQALVLDTEPIKRHVVTHCKKEPTPPLIRRCLIQAGELLLLAKEAAEAPGGQQIWGNCSAVTDLSKNTGWYYLLHCIGEQYQLKRHHPYPQYAELLFAKPRMRANWAVACRAEQGTRISACMKQQNRDFSRFWQYYLGLAGASAEPALARRLKHCLPDKVEMAVFGDVNRCLGV